MHCRTEQWLVEWVCDTSLMSPDSSPTAPVFTEPTELLTQTDRVMDREMLVRWTPGGPADRKWRWDVGRCGTGSRSREPTLWQFHSRAILLRGSQGSSAETMHDKWRHTYYTSDTFTNKQANKETRPESGLSTQISSLMITVDGRLHLLKENYI